MSMFSRFMLMLTLVFAGEIVFLLPFHTTRFFRPTLLEAFTTRAVVVGGPILARLALVVESSG